jgi:hypothetical protein
MATISDLVASVKDNLGNRETGKIGSRDINIVVVSNLNSAAMQIAKSKKHITALEKFITIAVTTADYLYSVPVVDKDGQTIRIKKIIKLHTVRSGETTGYPLERIHPLRRDTLFPITNANNSNGRPRLYSMYADKLEFYPFPDTSYTVNGRVAVWPTVFDINSASTGLGEEFDDVVENYATACCFQTLQQLEDSNWWNNQYKTSLRETLASLDDYPDENFTAGGYGTLIGEDNLGPTAVSGRTEAYNSALGIA